ncbi:MAG: ATP-binding protein [Defluviitaleaceae bacterium]|nr:ATP-binding protein [Defluviitaleaceae bacterium]MCL2240330.1 ATP-binding protein [Defluviitaleaceae bacterium]
MISYLTASAAYLNGGDSLIFMSTVGGGLISLTYLVPKASGLYTLFISVVQLGVLVFGVSLLGWRNTLAQNIIATLMAAGLNTVIYLFCKNYTAVLAESIKARNEAGRAAAVKSDFLSQMSHEIRNPLNAIIGMTTIGKNAKDLDTSLSAWQKVENSSIHLIGVVNDVLDTAKLESGKFELVYEDFYFRNVIERAVGIITNNTEEKAQALTVFVDDKIPAVLNGDAQRLAQIIVNLLNNASKFTPPYGKIELSAKLSDEKDSRCTIEICVADSGIGISLEQQENLFRAFSQAETTTYQKYGGTGLGLLISKNIADTMGGKIWIESMPDKGSSFYFSLQLERGNVFNEAPQENEFPDLSDKHILLAEDVEINREIVAVLLEPTGIKITFARNGIQAINLFKKSPEAFDFIFMDIKMPEADGYEATRQIRAVNHPRAKTIPIVAMTANVFSEDIEQCFLTGMNDHIGKPVTVETMLGALGKWLEA